MASALDTAGMWRGTAHKGGIHVLRNCPTCGRVLTSPVGVPCPFCEEEEDEACQIIERYLLSGGEARLATVMQATGVRLAVIRRLVANGRVHLADAGPHICEVCGEPLDTLGTICSRCRAQIGWRSASKGEPTEERGRGRMYSQDTD